MLAPNPLAPVTALFEAEKHRDVIKALEGERIPRLPRRFRPRAYQLLGLSLQASGDPSRALQIFQLAEGIYPKDINILTDLAHLLHNSGLDEQARPYYQRVLNIHPNNARSHLGLAEIYHNQGYLARAAEHYEKALREWNMHSFIWRDYARVLTQQSRLAEAVSAARKALALQPESESFLLLAAIERRQGLRSESYSHLDEAAAKNPSRTDIPLQRALWLMDDGRLDKAAVEASRVLKEEPDDPLAHWIKASIALRRGRKQEAKEEFEAAAEYEGTFVSRTARVMLESLR